jgi:hypothetical protein
LAKLRVAPESIEGAGVDDDVVPRKLLAHLERE